MLQAAPRPGRGLNPLHLHCRQIRVTREFVDLWKSARRIISPIRRVSRNGGGSVSRDRAAHGVGRVVGLGVFASIPARCRGVAGIRPGRNAAVWQAEPVRYPARLRAQEFFFRWNVVHDAALVFSRTLFLSQGGPGGMIPPGGVWGGAPDRLRSAPASHPRDFA